MLFPLLPCIILHGSWIICQVFNCFSPVFLEKSYASDFFSNLSHSQLNFSCSSSLSYKCRLNNYLPGTNSSISLFSLSWSLSYFFPRRLTIFFPQLNKRMENPTVHTLFLLPSVIQGISLLGRKWDLNLTSQQRKRLHFCAHEQHESLEYVELLFSSILTLSTQFK